MDGFTEEQNCKQGKMACSDKFWQYQGLLAQICFLSRDFGRTLVALPVEVLADHGALRQQVAVPDPAEAVEVPALDGGSLEGVRE